MIERATRGMIDEEQLLVSIVIVTYNGRQYLDDCLASVLDQDFPQEQYEIIVVDNASRDGSADFVEQNYPAARLVRSDRNYGPIQAIHRVKPQLRGKYLVSLHQDTVVHRRWLAELVDALDSHPQAAMVESNVILPPFPEYDPQRREGLLERAYICDVNSFCFFEIRTESVTSSSPPIPVLSAYGPSVIINQQVLDELDFFLDPNLHAHSDDLDAGLRVNLVGHHVLMAPRSVVYHNADHWHFKWDRRSVVKAFYTTRNVILVFYQIGYASELLCLLPRVLYGKLCKAGENTRSLVGRLLHALAAVPLVLLCLTAAFLRMPAYRERRQRTLSRRKMEPGWLVDRFLKIDWKADPTIWNGRSSMTQ